MRIWRIFLPAAALLLGAMAVGAWSASELPSHRNLLTFTGPVALPGVSLQAGTYTFELADPNASADVVVVMSRDRSRVYYLGMTERVERPATLSSDKSVTFGEAPRGAPAPITAWYPIGEMRGHRFIYSNR